METAVNSISDAFEFILEVVLILFRTYFKGIFKIIIIILLQYILEI